MAVLSKTYSLFISLTAIVVRVASRLLCSADDSTARLAITLTQRVKAEQA